MNNLLYENVSIKIEREDQLMICTFKPGIIIDKNISSLMISKRLEVSKGMDYFIISDTRGVKYWSMSSRNNDMKHEAFKGIKKCAIIITSVMLTTIWNFVIRLSPPPIEIKVFTNFSEARRWIKNKQRNELLEITT